MPQSLSEQYAADQEKRNREMRHRIASDANYDPDHAARVFHVSAVTNLPSQVVAEDLDGLEAQLKRKSFDYKEYTDEENGSPIFNAFALEDPYNFAVMERDRASMTSFERATSTIGLGWQSGRGVTELAELADKDIKGGLTPEDEERMKNLRSLVAGGDFGAEGHFMKTLVWTANQLPIQGWILKESADEMMLSAMAGALAGGLYGAAATAPLAGAGGIPGVAAGFTTGLGAGWLAGRSEAAFRLERGLAYDEYTQEGIDPRDALLMANGVGSINAVLESIGIGAMTKRIPGFRSIQRNAADRVMGEIFRTPKFSHALGRFTLAYGEGMATEVLTEVLQEATLMAAGENLKATYRDAGDVRPEMDAMTEEEFWTVVKDTAVQTMYGVALIGAVGPVSGGYRDYKRARAAKENQAGMAALGVAVDESKSQEGDSQTVWDKFVARVQEKGTLKEIRVDAEGFRKYWQDRNVDPEKAAAELDIDLAESEALDVDVVIPLETYVKKIAGTEHHAGLMPNVRIREGDMTFNEAVQWDKDADKHVEALEAALKEDFGLSPNQEIIDDVAGQLTTDKSNEKEAKVQARIYTAMISTAAAQAGVDPMVLHKERFGGIKREVPEALAGQDIDMDMDPLLDQIRGRDFPSQREIYGKSLFDLIREHGGIQDQGGELSARDVAKQFPGMVSKTGLTIDGIAEIAYDQGYISEYDSDLLLEALDRELGGEQQFGRAHKTNEHLEELLGRLEEAENFLETEGIDLQVMTNAEVRKYLKGMKTLEQSSDNDIEKWSDMVVMLAAQQDRLAAEKNLRDDAYGDFDTILSQAEVLMPRLAANQDFKDVTFTDKFVDKNGKTGTSKISAQSAYDTAVKKRNSLKRLLDCVNG